MRKQVVIQQQQQRWMRMRKGCQKKNSSMKLTFLSMPRFSSPIVVSSAMHTLVGAPSNDDAHCHHLPLPPPLLNTSLLLLPHHPIFFTIPSPPPHRCPSPSLSNRLVILQYHHCCCHPLLPSNADNRRCHPPMLVSNTIFASSPLLCLRPLMSPLNDIKRCHCHQTLPLPPPLNPVFIIHHCHRSFLWA